MKYYIADKTKEKNFREVSEAEFNEHKAFRSEVRAYTEQITNGEVTLADVPDTHREAVAKRLEPTIEEKAAAYDIIVGGAE